MKRYLLNRWTWILFGVALLPRIFDLERFITSDEQTNIFLAGSAVIQAMLRGDLRGTYWHFYPGVTMSWLDALGLIGQWLMARTSGLTTQPLTDYLNNDIRSLLFAARLPYVLLTALFVPIVYHLLRHWLDPQGDRSQAHYLALTAALFIAFDPFFLAHSRVVHGDAPVAVFMGLSIITLFLYLREGTRSLLIFSALIGGLAAITKAPGQLMAPFVIIVVPGYWLLMAYRGGDSNRSEVKQRLLEVVAWGGIALAVFVILWPSMWVDPLGTIRQMLDETFGKADEGHLVFFMGQPTLDPGPWFYPYVIPFRLTPLTTIGIGLSLVIVLFPAVSNFITTRKNRISDGSLSPIYAPTASLWFAILFFLISGIMIAKKQDRYLLPLFPLLDILAAIGWIELWRLVRVRWEIRPAWVGAAALGLIQAVLVLPYHPYFLAYFNPLMGGLPRAVETTLVGWGEGMEQAAAYLNQKPDAASLFVAATPSQTLLPFFKGRGENFYTNDVALRADYVVIYRTQQQRLAPSPEIVRHYLDQAPEKVITIEGVPYAWVYPNTRLIFDDVPAWATLANIGFGEIIRLAGYHAEQEDSTLAVDLFWHALPPIEADTGPCRQVHVENIETTICPRLDYTISLRLLDAGGNIIVQHDGWPVDGLLPTSQWQVGDYVQDHHLLALPANLPAGEYQLAVVVYNNETGAVLAGPSEFATITLL